jgi:integrase
MTSNRRRYFTQAELTKLINAARKGRYGHRDSTLILIMARHGLRVSEAVDLEWDQIESVPSICLCIRPPTWEKSACTGLPASS